MKCSKNIPVWLGQSAGGAWDLIAWWLTLFLLKLTQVSGNR